MSRADLRIADVVIPDSAVVRAAEEYLRDTSPETLEGHCRRTYVFGAMVARDAARAFDPELAYICALLHDLGLTERHGDERRFEVSGADAARSFARTQGLSEAEAEVVWDAVALHTAVGIADLKDPEVALVYWGASFDVMAAGSEPFPQAAIDEVFAAFPRGDFQEEFIALLQRAVKRNPIAYVSTWLEPAARCHFEPPLPGLEDALRASPFARRESGP